MVARLVSTCWLFDLACLTCTGMVGVVVRFSWFDLYGYVFGLLNTNDWSGIKLVQKHIIKIAWFCFARLVNYFGFGCLLGCLVLPGWFGEIKN